MFQVLFEKIIPFCPFWPNTVQNWSFWPKITKNAGFSHFYPNLFITICWFFLLSLVTGVGKKWRFRIFRKNSKMAHFGQNWPKFGLNLTKMTKNEGFPHFWSLHYWWMDLWNHPRSSIRPYVTRYLGNHSLLFNDFNGLRNVSRV